ncbi:xanthine dehydrogenase family protein molybdopterin-binding subunit [Streptomyces hirsutus]
MTGTGSTLGAPAERREGHQKVTGSARYAAEHPLPGRAHAWPVPATIARGRVTAVDTAAALDLPGVLTVLTHEDAPRIADPDDPTLAVLQDPRVPHRGWCVALVVARSPEEARAAAGAVRVEYAVEEHDVALRADHPDVYEPETANGGNPARREHGDPEGAFASAPVRVDAAYRVPPLHNHPMEPHTSTAHWQGDQERLVVHTSSQGTTTVRATLAALFGMPEDRITVTAGHVGGGFGSKGTPRPDVVLAVMAARRTGRPVTVALPRRHLPASVGHRAPTLHRIRLGAGTDGRLTGLTHDVVTHSSRIKEFVEQAAVPARVMYAVPHSRTLHRLVRLDVPTPSWMRAPGEAPGMYALESAMDELAGELGMDPIQLRLVNEPDREPDSGKPFSSRHLTECLRDGARRFGWTWARPAPPLACRGPPARRHGRRGSHLPRSRGTVHRRGTRTAGRNCSSYGSTPPTSAREPARCSPRWRRTPSAHPSTGCGTEVGDSDLPPAPLAGGSCRSRLLGLVRRHEACTRLAGALAARTGPLRRRGDHRPRGAATGQADADSPYARHAFGAHFAETSVDRVTGEVRVRRLLSVYAAGRILNARTARSPVHRRHDSWAWAWR